VSAAHPPICSPVALPCCRLEDAWCLVAPPGPPPIRADRREPDETHRRLAGLLPGPCGAGRGTERMLLKFVLRARGNLDVIRFAQGASGDGAAEWGITP
jgi:hypothetical protein